MNVQLGAGETRPGIEVTADFQVITFCRQRCFLEVDGIIFESCMGYMTERVLHQAIDVKYFCQRTQVGSIDRYLHTALARFDQPVQVALCLDLQAAEVTFLRAIFTDWASDASCPVP